MSVYSYSLSNKRRDLSPALNTVTTQKKRFLSKFKTAARATNQKHEWHEDQIQGRGFTVTAYWIFDPLNDYYPAPVLRWYESEPSILWPLSTAYPSWRNSAAATQYQRPSGFQSWIHPNFRTWAVHQKMILRWLVRHETPDPLNFG